MMFAGLAVYWCYCIGLKCRLTCSVVGFMFVGLGVYFVKCFVVGWIACFGFCTCDFASFDFDVVLHFCCLLCLLWCCLCLSCFSLLGFPVG